MSDEKPTDETGASVKATGGADGTPPSATEGASAPPVQAPEPLVRPHVEPREPPAPATPPAKRSDQARSPVVRFFSGLFTLALLLVMGVGALFYFGREEFVAPGPLAQDAIVIIPSGSGVEGIASTLQGRGVISNSWLFIAAAQLSGDSARLKAGEFAFRAGASMRSVMATIISGQVVQHTLTIPEGLSSAQIVQRLNEDPVLVGSLTTIPPEGSLLPETYLFVRGTTRAQMVDRMQKAMTRALDEAWAARDPALPIRDKRELLVLASVVEKETGVAGERPRVAAVFVNRLRKGMRLQSDPTILYGLYGGSAWTQDRSAIQRSEIDRPNPYNTYQIAGLPPGPIANPGEDALMAVARPAVTAELFFVADGSGGHVFAVTLDEHQRNVARWRAIEQQRRAGQGAGQ